MKKYEIEFNSFIPLALIVEAENKQQAIMNACNDLGNIYTPEMVESVTELN